MSRPPRWLSLKIPLGPVGLTPGELLGVVIDVAGSVPASVPRIRSRTQSGVVDTALDWAPDTETEPARRARSLLHRAAPGDGVLRDDAFHTLVLPLEKRDQQITVFALACFVLSEADA